MALIDVAPPARPDNAPSDQRQGNAAGEGSFRPDMELSSVILLTEPSIS